MATNKLILLIDDDEAFSEEFSKLSITYDVLTDYKTNYRDMVKELPLIAGKLSCIVLDIHCLIEPDQKIEKEDFIGQAISFLDQNYKQIPRVILTADPTGYDTVKKYFSKEKVFLKKSKDIVEMLQYIHTLDIESFKIRMLYSDVFEIIEKTPINSDIETQIIDLIKKAKSKDYSEILDSLARIRRIQESIFQTINKANKDILPDTIFKENKDINFREIHKHLKGNPSWESKHKPVTKVFYSGVTAHFSEVLYRVSSDNGSHNPFENPDYLPTSYTVEALVNALMDFIRWFGSLKIKKV